MRKQAGFTLIELVMVIVILGILAATALPRFVNLQANARAAAVNGMAGALRASASLARAQYMATGTMTATTVAMDGVNVDVAAGTGIPAATATGIVAALQDTAGFNITYAAGVATFAPTNGGPGTCEVTYTAVGAVVAVATGGC